MSITLVVGTVAILAGDAVPTPLKLSCFTADPWRLVSSREHKAIIYAVMSEGWKDMDSFQRPSVCRLVVKKACAPDLDGDGSSEWLIKLTWVVGINDFSPEYCDSRTTLPPTADYWPGIALVLMSNDGMKWRQRGILDSLVETGQTSAVPGWVYGYGKLASGQIVVRGVADSGETCEPGAIWLARLTSSGVVKEYHVDPVPFVCTVLSHPLAEHLPRLIEGLRDGSDQELQALHAQAIGTLGTSAQLAVPHLVELVANERAYRPAREAAARALGEIGSAAREAIPALERLAASRDGILRGIVQTALDKIRGTESR